MKTWNQLLVRHGWLLKEVEENVFDCGGETATNLEFLYQTLDQLEISYQQEGKILVLQQGPVSEKRLLGVLDVRGRGRGEDLWFQPGVQQPIVHELDTYIAGLVRQLNRLGLYTNQSCDGHGRPATIGIIREKNVGPLVAILDDIQVGTCRIRTNDRTHLLRISYEHPAELLDLAEKLQAIPKKYLELNETELTKALFEQQLESLLSIPGVSGRESKIRQYVMERLAPFVDHISVDAAGNVLAEKTYRHGHGPTILLSAHLDVYEEIIEGRTIVKNGQLWSSNEGILGADDRAGIAVILHVARKLLHSNFSGKVKYIFSVEEEVGLVGARNVSDYFLWGTDAAIVVDRRGTGDIVTSCGGYIPFCDEAYGQFFEKKAMENQLDGWKCVSGGSSDARVWASHGIQSVNLSAGYQHEHTEHETLDVKACFTVTQLILGVFAQARELRQVLRHRENVR